MRPSKIVAGPRGQRCDSGHEPGGTAARDDVPVRDVSIRDDSIRLGQFLKLAGLVDAGSDVKLLLDAGEVEVNGTPEVRRGRQLQRGDVVSVGEADLRIT